MLILARKKGQSIVLNDDIEIIIADVQKDVVKVGIKAPKSVSIFRKEIYQEITEENKRAADAKPITLPKMEFKKI